MSAFRDRPDAGRQLATRLEPYAHRSDVVVLGLPRGGVPVAAEVAARLDAPLDVFVVRKLGVPGHEELAMGAIASGGARVLNGDVVAGLDIPSSMVEAVTRQEQAELERRERLYRGGRDPVDIRGRTVILVDDGLATGASMRAAVTALRARDPARLVVAVPVGAPETCAAFETIADEVVCAIAPPYFAAVGSWYDDFGQTTDDEVQDLLERGARRTTQAASGARGSQNGGAVKRSTREQRRNSATPRTTTPRARAGEARAIIIEHGDIFFFYRPRVETGKVGDRGDVQRFFMLLAAERDRRQHFRLFVIGRKRMPEIRRGEAHPEERNWAVNVLTTSDAARVRRELLAKEYGTATRGTRLVGAAKPVGEGRYQLVKHGGHSELAYVLELPRKAGVAQAEFEIKDTASYIVAVKNPEVRAPGFPEREETARLPQRLRAKFGGRRWIEADDPALLDHEGVEILLLGAHADQVEKELGIDIDDEAETAHSAELFRTLRLRKEARGAPLFRGEFPTEELPVQGEEIERTAGARLARQTKRATRVPAARARGSRREFRCDTCNETFETRSRYERHMMTAHPTPAPSAADVERALEGIDFPKSRRALVAHASKRLEAHSPTLELIRTLPPRRYRDAAGVAVALGEVKRGASPWRWRHGTRRTDSRTAGQHRSRRGARRRLDRDRRRGGRTRPRGGNAIRSTRRGS